MNSHTRLSVSVKGEITLSAHKEHRVAAMERSRTAYGNLATPLSWHQITLEL